MADAADRASDVTHHFNEKSIQKARNNACLIPQGNPGDCDFCGEWSGRLVRGACAPCRDRLGRD